MTMLKEIEILRSVVESIKDNCRRDQGVDQKKEYEETDPNIKVEE